MTVVNKFNVNKEQVTLDADIIENMSANDVSYNSSLQYDENTVGDKLSELEAMTKPSNYTGTGTKDIFLSNLKNETILSIRNNTSNPRSLYGISGSQFVGLVNLAANEIKHIRLTQDFDGIRLYTSSTNAYDVDIIIGELGYSFDVPNISNTLLKKVDERLGYNIFNPNDDGIAIGKYIADAEGNLGTNISYNTSGFIPIEIGKTYSKASDCFRGFRRVLFYDSSKRSITNSYISTDCDYFVVPDGAAFVRVTFYNVYYDLAQIAEGNDEKPYIPYNIIGGYLTHLYSKVKSLSSQFADGSAVVTKTGTTGTSFYPNEFGLSSFKKDSILSVYGETNGTTLMIYGDAGSGFINLGDINRNPLHPTKIVLDTDYVRLQWYSNEATSSKVSVRVDSDFSYLEHETERLGERTSQLETSKPCKVLYLGDSYTEGARWIAQFEKMMNVTESLNLGISSANIKDIHVDRSLYPYGSRPFQGILGSDGTEGNLNVFSSQIEQLKRMVAGNLHGILWKLTINSVSGNGTLSLAFMSGTQTINVTSSDTTSEVAEIIAGLNVPNYSLVHPQGTNYVLIEALSNTITSAASVSSSVVNCTNSTIKAPESYTLTSSPNLVIIAGGKNDHVDTEEKVNSYESQILTLANVYYKRRNTSVTQGQIYVPTAPENVDRTCFCGALRYLIEEIHALFPNTSILVVGTSNLNYGGVGLSNDAQKNEQMKKATSLLSLPFVSWFDNSMYCNRVFNKPSGSGTQSDPYVLDEPTEYTLDMMHPNELGGKYLASIVAFVARSVIQNLL